MFPPSSVSGGPMLAGHMSDGRRTCLSHMFEAVGAYHAGTLDEDGVEEYVDERMPLLRLLFRHVHRQLYELPHRGHRHGTAGQRHHSRRLLRPSAPCKAGRHAGDGAAPQEHPSPRYHDRATPSTMPRPWTWRWAAPPIPCCTCLPLPMNAGIDIDLAHVPTSSMPEPPNLCHLAPAGDTFMEDLERAGGVYAVMKELADAGLIKTDLIDLHRQDRGGESSRMRRICDHEIIRPIDNPYLADRRHCGAVRQSGARWLRGKAVCGSP